MRRNKTNKSNKSLNEELFQQKRPERTTENWGFGDTYTGHRMLNKDGTFNVKRQGFERYTTRNAYHLLLSISWLQFFLLTALVYTLMNSIYALLYLLAGIEHLYGIKPGDFVHNFFQAFFFSTQTFTTLGYGTVAPIGFWANLIASSETLVGLLSFSLATGLVYGRFSSRPSVGIQFSNNALITPYGDINSLQFRIVNGRNNQIMNLEAKATLSYVNRLKNNETKRKFELLELETNKIKFFPLNWTIVHPINENSILRHWTEETMQQHDVELLILLKGYDDTIAQDVYQAGSYKWHEIIWNAEFEPAFYQDSEGATVLNLKKLNNYKKI